MSDEQRYNIWFDQEDRWAHNLLHSMHLINKYHAYWTHDVVRGFTMEECQEIMGSGSVWKSTNFSIRPITYKSDRAARQAHADKYL